MNPDLSVVFPVFNERENLSALVSEIHAVLDPLGISYEVVAVDDGSTDGSFEVLRDLAQSDHRIRILRLARNSGQTAALDAGWRGARGRLVVSLDADLQNDPADIPRMLERLERERADMVIGIRANRKDTLSKKIQSRIGNTVRNIITGDHITDTGCSLKLLRRSWIDRVKLFSGMHRFLPTLVRMEGGTVIEMRVNHRARTWGTSKYGALNRAWRGLMDCFAVRWMTSRVLRYQLLPEEER